MSFCSNLGLNYLAHRPFFFHAFNGVKQGLPFFFGGGEGYMFSFGFGFLFCVCFFGVGGGLAFAVRKNTTLIDLGVLVCLI